MIDEELFDVENCNHVWVYDHESFDTVFLRCPRCNMIRLAGPGEIVARLNMPQKVKAEEE